MPSLPVTIGVLCLETYFTKIPGHIRNPATFDFPVRYKVVEGASPARLVVQADPSLLEPFIEAARALEAEGCAAITGSCGFLALFQKELTDAVDVPLFASSLLQVPLVHRLLRSNQKVGVLTARKASLTARHLEASGAGAVPICVAGLDGKPEFNEVIIEQRRRDLNVERLSEEVRAATRQLIEDHPDVGALVIECTDLPPFARVIQDDIQRPVVDIVTLTNMVYAGLTRHEYSRDSNPTSAAHDKRGAF